MNTFNTLLMGLAAAFFAALAFYLSHRLAQAKRENDVLWDQAKRYEAYISERAADDEVRQRAAVLN